MIAAKILGIVQDDEEIATKILGVTFLEFRIIFRLMNGIFYFVNLQCFFRMHNS